MYTVKQETQKARRVRQMQEHMTALALSEAPAQHKHNLARGNKAAHDLPVCVWYRHTSCASPRATHVLMPFYSFVSLEAGTFRKPIEPLRVGVVSLSNLSAGKMLETYGLPFEQGVELALIPP